MAADGPVSQDLKTLQEELSTSQKERAAAAAAALREGCEGERREAHAQSARRRLEEAPRACCLVDAEGTALEERRRIRERALRWVSDAQTGYLN
jgi:hypothetical protein